MPRAEVELIKEDRNEVYICNFFAEQMIVMVKDKFINWKEQVIILYHYHSLL